MAEAELIGISPIFTRLNGVESLLHLATREITSSAELRGGQSSRNARKSSAELVAGNPRAKRAAILRQTSWQAILAQCAATTSSAEHVAGNPRATRGNHILRQTSWRAILRQTLWRAILAQRAEILQVCACERLRIQAGILRARERRGRARGAAGENRQNRPAASAHQKLCTLNVRPKCRAPRCGVRAGLGNHRRSAHQKL